MSKKKLNTNGTLLNLLLLGGAAVILKKRTGSLRGVGATRYYQFSPIEDKLYERQMELFEEWERADEENPMNVAENDKYYRDLIFRLEELQDKIYNRRWQKQFGNNRIGNKYDRYFNSRGEAFERILDQANFIQEQYERDLLNAGYTKQTAPAIVANAYWQKYSQEFNSLINRLQTILENQQNL